MHYNHLVEVPHRFTQHHSLGNRQPTIGSQLCDSKYARQASGRGLGLGRPARDWPWSHQVILAQQRCVCLAAKTLRVRIGVRGATRKDNGGCRYTWSHQETCNEEGRCVGAGGMVRFSRWPSRQGAYLLPPNDSLRCS